MVEWQTSLSAAVDGADWVTVMDVLLQRAHEVGLPLGEDERARRIAFATLIARHCEAGHHEQAMAVAEADFHRIDGLKSVALAEIGTGGAGALERLLSLPLETSRQMIDASTAVADTALEMAHRGDREGALALMGRARDQGWRNSSAELIASTVPPLAFAYATLGQFEAAHALLESASVQVDETWYEIAREEIRQGQAERAASTIARIQNPTRQRHARIELALRQHDADRARTIAQEAEKVRAQETRLSQAYPELDTILALLAREALKAGQREDALRYMADIDRPQLRAMELAQAHVDAGDVDEALSLTEGMEGSLARDLALLASIARCAAAGDMDAATGLLENVVSVDSRDRARGSIVEAQCARQDFEGAFHTVHAIQSEKQMAQPLGVLLTTLYTSGRHGAAIKMTLQLPRSLLLALDPLTRAMLAAGDGVALGQVLPRCAESLASAWRWCTSVATLHPDLVPALSAVAIRY